MRLACLSSPFSRFRSPAAWASRRTWLPGSPACPRARPSSSMPTDIELFSISGGGWLKPKADWDRGGDAHFKTALRDRKQKLGFARARAGGEGCRQLAEVNTLHAADRRARSHSSLRVPLPTKEGKLDWSLGRACAAIKKLTGADYAFSAGCADSYAAPKGSGDGRARLRRRRLAAACRVGYASLVDLNTGQVLWFNRLLRRARRPGGKRTRRPRR